MTCPRPMFNDPTIPLVCTQAGEHATHVYHSTTGSDLGEGAHHGKDPEE